MKQMEGNNYASEPLAMVPEQECKKQRKPGTTFPVTSYAEQKLSHIKIM